MGMVRIQTYGSFGVPKTFETTAEKGGHVAALKRGILFLTEELENAVQRDVDLAQHGSVPPQAHWGCDK